MNPVPLPACGIHPNVPFEQYQQWPAANFSTIKNMRGTASKCKWEMDHPKVMTPAMILGSALHIATLEPARFESMFHICPPCDRRTKEGKEFYAEEERKAEGKIMIRRGGEEKDKAAMGEVESVQGMARAIHASEKASALINGMGQNEVCLLWKDEETGLMCKARCDRIVTEFDHWGWGKIPVIIELKSCRNADDYWFGKDCKNRGYDTQAASYCHGYYKITGRRPAHVIIAVENTPPHDMQPHMLDDKDMQTGLLQYRNLLTRYAECLKSGNWLGYPDKINTLALPAWVNEGAVA